MLLSCGSSAGAGFTPITTMGTRRDAPPPDTDANVAAVVAGSCESTYAGSPSALPPVTRTTTVFRQARSESAAIALTTCARASLRALVIGRSVYVLVSWPAGIRLPTPTACLAATMMLAAAFEEPMPNISASDALDVTLKFADVVYGA